MLELKELRHMSISEPMHKVEAGAGRAAADRSVHGSRAASHVDCGREGSVPGRKPGCGRDGLRRSPPPWTDASALC